MDWRAVLDSQAMRLVVITPVGPGHEEYAKECIQSVKLEIERVRNETFVSIKHVIIDDTEGKLGRSKARNIGMESPSDWYFFVDADDRVAVGAFGRCDFAAPATFGAIQKIGGEYAFNVHPCGWREVALFGCYGTLSMGLFLNGKLGIKFNEELDAGEDYEFYMRLPSFSKVHDPLVEIGYNRNSAVGPRGYKRIDWIETCNAQIVKAVESNRAKYDLDGAAVLAKKVSPRKHTRPIQDAVC